MKKILILANRLVFSRIKCNFELLSNITWEIGQYNFIFFQRGNVVLLSHFDKKSKNSLKTIALAAKQVGKALKHYAIVCIEYI